VGQLEEHLTGNCFTIELLGFDFFVDLGTQLFHLVDELRAQFRISHPLEGLKLAFLLDWTHQCGTVAIREHLLDQTADAILVVN